MVVLLFISIGSQAQKSQWAKLGCAEKVWVLLHPFSANKARKITNRSLESLDSLKLKYSFGNTQSGSKFDATRHAYWMSLLAANIGDKRALWLGRAHEKKNKKDFERATKEDGLLPDSVAIEMDLFNNKIGAAYGDTCKKCSDSELLKAIILALEKGELLYIKQDDDGNFLDAENKIIPKSEWSGKWQNNRLLVPTNYDL